MFRRRQGFGQCCRMGQACLAQPVCVASGLGIMPSTWILAGSFPPILPPKKTPLDSGSVTSQVRKMDG